MSKITFPPLPEPHTRTPADALDASKGARGNYTAEQMQERDRQIAALVRAQVIEEAAHKCSVLAQERETDYVTNFDCADALRGMKSEPGHSVSSVAEASTAPPAEPQEPPKGWMPDALRRAGFGEKNHG